METAEQTRERKNGYQRKWYSENKDQHNAAVARWVERNKEQVAEYRKQYAKDNRERINARARERYAANKEKFRDKAKKAYVRNGDKIRTANDEYRKNKKDWLFDQLESVGCKHCGMKDRRCLEFHHRDPSTKLFHVQGCWSKSEDELLAEMAKCDVLCANCHRIHHRTKEQQAE